MKSFLSLRAVRSPQLEQLASSSTSASRSRWYCYGLLLACVGGLQLLLLSLQPGLASILRTANTAVQAFGGRKASTISTRVEEIPSGVLSAAIDAMDCGGESN